MTDYHNDDCDCIECDARRQHDGLDYDPSNDNDKFERHEEEMLNNLATCPSRKEIKEKVAEEPKMASKIKEKSIFKTPDEERLKELKQEMDSTLRYSFPWLTLQQKYRDLFVKIYGNI